MLTKHLYNKKASDSPASTDNGTEAGHITADGEIVSQKGEFVNTRNDRAVIPLIQNTFGKEAV